MCSNVDPLKLAFATQIFKSDTGLGPDVLFCFFFFSFVLCLVSLAHRVPCAEALHWGASGQGSQCEKAALTPQPWWAVCRDAVPSMAIWSLTEGHLGCFEV